MTDESYAEQIAGWRAQRWEQERRQRLTELHEEHARNVQSRDQLLRDGDAETAAIYDDSAQQNEAEYLRLQPPQQPTLTEAKQQFLSRHQDWIQRNGQRGLQAIAAAHDFVTRPRNPHSTQDMTAGMGIRDDDGEQYFSAMSNVLSMYAKDYGLSGFDTDGLPTPDDVCSMVGISPRSYNQAAKEMWDSGRDSGSLLGQQWKKYG